MEVDLILRILDPDQSGHVEMEEWLDFMLATENDLEKHTRNTEHKINAINGEKSLLHDVSAAASSLKDQTVGTVTVDDCADQVIAELAKRGFLA